MKIPMLTLLLGTVSVGAFGGPADVTTDARTLERGRYLAHEVAMCVQCHTPRRPDGELDMTRLFRGAAIPVDSPLPNGRWAFRAPALAGLPGWSRKDLSHLLQTGQRPDGRKPAGPMPPFRLSAGDADAVAAYLESVR